MSSCTNYSQSPNNIYKLSDEEISKYYNLAEKSILGSCHYGYLLHKPMIIEDHHNIYFLRDSNKFVNKKKNTNLNENVNTELKKQIDIAKNALDEISFILNKKI